ncbi:cyclase family protein [Georgenia alba]|uniref:Cyclase family protein n=1 Tax=Georgenia alba TaxID=2233858 RepID=A0ABW2Q8S7_9MICO
MILRWNRRPEGSTWGDFGADDVLGRLNLLTPEKVREGVAEVREGLAIPLSLPLDRPGGPVLNPSRRPPVVRPTLRRGRVNLNCAMSELEPGLTDVMCDDLVVLHTQYSTQWDSLAHVGSMFDVEGDGTPRPVYYNGFRAGEDIVGPATPEHAGADSLPGPSTSSAGPLGIDTIAQTAVQGRGVLLDLRAHLGDARQPVAHAQLTEIMAADDVVVEPGDILVLHTGFAQHVLDMGEEIDAEALDRVGAGLDGRDPELLEWVTDSGVAAIVADNYAVEVFPARAVDGPASFLPLHEHCLFRLGVPLGELWYVTELAAALRERRRSRFLLTAPPLRLPGAVASPLTPVATL